MFLSEMFNLQKELDKLFNVEYSPYSTYSRRSYPAVNLFEQEDKLVVKSEVPGLSKEDLSITLENDVLCLQGQIEKGRKDDLLVHRQERACGEFNRSIKLPYKVDAEKVNANLENGILSISLEREESSKPRSITIN